MILGNIKSFKGLGYVCFIDVLGFSNDILKNWRRNSSNPLDKILSIKKRMPGFNQIDEGDESSSRRSYACRVNTISDSVTICFGFNDEIIFGDLALGLEVILSNLAYVWATFIHNGYTIRGAIDFGDIYWDENELIGPALINAYRLESEAARVSRVVVSSGLNKVLCDLMKIERSTMINHLMRNFRKDIDGYIIVDPKILYKSDKEQKVLIDHLNTMRNELPIGIVREKYTPLISMLNDTDKNALKLEDVGRY
ncbi:MAG: hypothetical protein ACQETH_17010 [Candidatus Rifleibacteriota bacterium]